MTTPTGDHPNRRPTLRPLPTLGLAVGIVLVTATVALATGFVRFGDRRDNDTPGVRIDEVVDADSGGRYLAETIDAYLPPGEVLGTFEFLRAPLSDVVAFQNGLGISEPAWEANESQTAVVLTWTPRTDVAFLVPRPRHGIDATVQADAFVIILEPVAGLEIRAMTTTANLVGLRFSATDRQAMDLAVRGVSE